MKLKAGFGQKQEYHVSLLPFFLIMVLLNLAVSLLTSLVGSLYRPDSFNTGIFDGWSMPAVFFAAVIAGPFLETLIYQFALIEGTLHYTGKNRGGVLLAIGISAFVFGISHLYNLVYMAAAMCMGLSLAYTYIRFKAREGVSPFLAVFAIHALVNCVAFIVNEVL